MGQQQLVLINNFSGGSSEDKRAGWSRSSSRHPFTTNRYSITKHFDTYTYPEKLVPYNKTQATDGESKGQNIRKVVYTAGKLYGLGDQAGNLTRVQVYQNNGFGTTDSWGTATNGAGSTNNKSTDVFFPYKTFIFMLVNTDRISRFDTAGGAFVDNFVGSGGTNNFTVSYSYTVQAQPVLHPSDDIAYFFTDYTVLKTSDGATFTNSALVLPSTQRIISACPYGNYLAIGCITTDSYNPRSIVYLWDRDSSITTLSERIDFGEGKLLHLATLDNQLIAIMQFYADDALGLRKGKVHIKRANGTSSVILHTLTSDLNWTAANFSAKSFIRDEKIYYALEADWNGDKRIGIWVTDSAGRTTLAIYEPEIDVSNGSVQGIYATAEIWWISHSADGSLNRSSYTNYDYSSNNYGLYESLIFNALNSSLTKKLIGVTVNYEPNTYSNATIILQYRKDNETSWTQIFSVSNSDGSLSHDAINIESTGATLPQFNEIQFRILSIGGIITGLTFLYEDIENAAY